MAVAYCNCDGGGGGGGDGGGKVNTKKDCLNLIEQRRCSYSGAYPVHVIRERLRRVGVGQTS